MSEINKVVRFNMSYQFTPIAQSRARYYSKGSPVQFVRVELLRMEETEDLVATLTFKNVHVDTLTSFTVHFRCKSPDGEIMLEDDFVYDGLNVLEGELFGADDAVVVSEERIGSVEVNLIRAEYSTGRSYNLTRCENIDLPAIKKLPAVTVNYVNEAMRFSKAHYLPCNLPDGWVCTCGAFNYNVGHGADTCSECGADKRALYGAVRAGLKAAQAAGTTASSVARAAQNNIEHAQAEAPRTLNTQQTRVLSTAQIHELSRPEGGEAAVSWMSDETADFILKFAPIITAGASLLYIAGALTINLLLK